MGVAWDATDKLDVLVVKVLVVTLVNIVLRCVVAVLLNNWLLIYFRPWILSVIMVVWLPLFQTICAIAVTFFSLWLILIPTLLITVVLIVMNGLLSFLLWLGL